MHPGRDRLFVAQIEGMTDATAAVDRGACGRGGVAARGAHAAIYRMRPVDFALAIGDKLKLFAGGEREKFKSFWAKIQK
jgi:hypothetical protein